MCQPSNRVQPKLVTKSEGDRKEKLVGEGEDAQTEGRGGRTSGASMNITV